MAKSTFVRIAVLVLATPWLVVAGFGQEYKLERVIGHAPEVGEPKGLAVDRQGNIYVTDRFNGRLMKITGQRMATPQALRALRFQQPTAVAVDAQGNLLVAEEGGIQRISPTGKRIRGFSVGLETAEIKAYISAIALDQAGNLYVSDVTNNQVLKFNSQGQRMAAIGKPGKGPGEFAGPQGLAVDGAGNLYVADEFNNRIQKFNVQGNFLGQSSPETLGQTLSQGLGPMGVAADSKGNIWVAAHTNFAVYKLDPSFRMLVRLETFGRRNGELAGPIAVAVDASDNVLVLDKSRRIQKFDPQGNFVSKFAFPEAKGGELAGPTGVLVDAEGNLWVSDTANFRIQKFDRNGRFLLSFGQFGQGPGEFNGGESIAVDRHGNLYVADSYNHRVQKFDRSGKFLLRFGSFGSRPGEFSRSKVVCADPSGDAMYVNDWNNARVQKFDLNGNFMAAFGNTGPPEQRVLGPTGLAADREGNVYVSSWFNNTIQKFDSQGKYLGSIGRQGTGDGEFKGPARLAINADGNLVVVDWGNNRIQVLDTQGRFVTKFGQLGQKEGMFNQPVGVAVDAQGRLFISDANNARVQVFSRGSSPIGRKNKEKPQQVPGGGSTSNDDSVPATRAAAGKTAATSGGSIYTHIAIYDVAPGMADAFAKVLLATATENSGEPSLVNERILKNLDPLTLQYATYSKYLSREAAERVYRKRLERLRPYCRREPEAHTTQLTRVYYPAGVSEKPSGLEFGVGQKGQIAHLGLFIPFPHYRTAYNDVLYETKVLTRAKQPHGYIGEDVLDETDLVAPPQQTPYSPKAAETAKMSFNYGEYQTMEDAEDSYIARQQAPNPKLITMERIFYSALQVPTRFYIFQVIENYGGASAKLAGRNTANAGSDNR